MESYDVASTIRQSLRCGDQGFGGGGESAAGHRQGLPLVHVSAQHEHFLWDALHGFMDFVDRTGDSVENGSD